GVDRRPVSDLRAAQRPFPQEPASRCGPPLVAGVVENTRGPCAIRARDRIGGHVLQPASAARISRCDFRAVPARHLDRPGQVSRRKLITRGLAAVTGLSGVMLANRIADRYGLIPPDNAGVYGPGETLTYGVHRLLTRHSLAREFSRREISKPPFANETAPPTD